MRCSRALTSEQQVLIATLDSQSVCFKNLTHDIDGDLSIKKSASGKYGSLERYTLIAHCKSYSFMHHNRSIQDN